MSATTDMVFELLVFNRFVERSWTVLCWYGNNSIIARAWALIVRKLFGHYGNVQSNFCAGHLVLKEIFLPESNVANFWGAITMSSTQTVTHGKLQPSRTHDYLYGEKFSIFFRKSVTLAISYKRQKEVVHSCL